ncbi:hypothetical protein [Marinobacter alkaliphilus]|uniref:hypothetical protein n=1 Tax=Marinobacter alkaliphilus TaxID=254719 RepID=UPI003D769E93
MAIVLDGTVAIQRDQSGDVANVIWFLYGLPASGGAPNNAVFLNESFGKASPQMVSFELDGEEYVVYADWQSSADVHQGHEIKAFYKTYGYILISCLRDDVASDEGLIRREWITPVKYYEDYVTMVSELAKVG